MLITNVEYALFAARSNNNQISRQIKKSGCARAHPLLGYRLLY